MSTLQTRTPMLSSTHRWLPGAAVSPPCHGLLTLWDSDGSARGAGGSLTWSKDLETRFMRWETRGPWVVRGWWCVHFKCIRACTGGRGSLGTSGSAKVPASRVREGCDCQEGPAKQLADRMWMWLHPHPVPCALVALEYSGGEIPGPEQPWATGVASCQEQTGVEGRKGGTGHLQKGSRSRSSLLAEGGGLACTCMFSSTCTWLLYAECLPTSTSFACKSRLKQVAGQKGTLGLPSCVSVLS